MHPTSHFLAAWFKLRRPEVTWYAEFSDPVRQNVQGERATEQRSSRPGACMADLAGRTHDRGFAARRSDNLFTWLETHHVRRGGRDHLHQRESARVHARPFPGRQLRARAAEHSTVSPTPVPEPWLYRTITSS